MLIYDDLDIGGEYLGVDMNARLVGVASGLSRIMAAAVKKARKPVFFCVAIQGETSNKLSRWPGCPRLIPILLRSCSRPSLL